MENLNKCIVEIENLCKDLFEKIKIHNSNPINTKFSLIFNLYGKIVEYVDSILTNLDKSQYYTAKTTSASLIEIVIHIMYISISDDNKKDFEDFYYIDALKLLDKPDYNGIIGKISKDDLKEHNCQRFKSDKVDNVTDENILNRKTYQKNYYKDNTIKDLLYGLNIQEEFKELFYSEYRYFCDYKHDTPFSIIMPQTYEKDSYNIYTVISISLIITQTIINYYIDNKFDIITYQNNLDNITKSLGNVLKSPK